MLRGEFVRLVKLYALANASLAAEEQQHIGCAWKCAGCRREPESSLMRLLISERTSGSDMGLIAAIDLF